ncbi:DUF2809 domain-containing protein [Roseofilum sp. BLCC_M91]|uniref:DUF2809 domain-containing protein n=1 Tax=Roseofilum halophilum BLCC-M91 TaxID=3022259 RepID=A0ABT7BQC4_9CYAN|nr:DUF2809 domain-containing protein [Roseofilum halophilum]MDJ1181398.1 DUF2809 domain-containing protein [Roseofilum halophilum BLCC-M91]
MQFQLKAYRRWLLVSLIAIIPLGMATKFYRGWAEGWIIDYAGGILYEILWMILVTLAWPRLRLWKVAIAVFLFTSFLEVLQLWHPPLLQAMRSTLLGQLILGTTFVWWDFPHYAIGCYLGWLGLRELQKSLQHRH